MWNKWVERSSLDTLYDYTKFLKKFPNNPANNKMEIIKSSPTNQKIIVPLWLHKISKRYPVLLIIILQINEFNESLNTIFQEQVSWKIIVPRYSLHNFTQNLKDIHWQSSNNKMEIIKPSPTNSWTQYSRNKLVERSSSLYDYTKFLERYPLTIILQITEWR